MFVLRSLYGHLEVNVKNEWDDGRVVYVGGSGDYCVISGDKCFCV